jgi:cytochrome c biogenesis protein CcmG, thiol:disulfide interchange protein DsbE
VSAPPAARRRRRGAVILVAVAAVAGFVLAGRLRDGEATAQSVLVGHPAPVLHGSTLDGGTFDLAQWRGQVVLVNIWASWCGPCRQELPLLASAYAALQPRGLHVVGIDVRDAPDRARAFQRQYGDAPWPSVQDPDGERAVDWGTFALPESYVVDRDGTVVGKAVGALDARWIDERVVPLLRASR